MNALCISLLSLCVITSREMYVLCGGWFKVIEVGKVFCYQKTTCCYNIFFISSLLWSWSFSLLWYGFFFRLEFFVLYPAAQYNMSPFVYDLFCRCFVGGLCGGSRYKRGSTTLPMSIFIYVECIENGKEDCLVVLFMFIFKIIEHIFI